MGKKIEELEGESLDYWVMRALGWEHLGAIGTNEPNDKGIPWCRSERNNWWKTPDGEFKCGDCYGLPYPFSTDWSRGGPIVEQEHIDLEYDEVGKEWIGIMFPWKTSARNAISIFGKTPLIAAMRAYVASVYGEEVPDA